MADALCLPTLAAARSVAMVGTPIAGLILVLYRPESTDLTQWLRLRPSCPNLLVVDNSEHVDQPLHASLQQAGIQVLLNRNQGGLAGAYNRGSEWLQAQGCELIFLFDQDSSVCDDFFEHMLAACSGLRGRPFIMGPRIYETRLQRYMPAVDPARRWPRLISMANREQGLIPSLCVISSGSVVSLAAWRLLGGFRDDYFIEYVDVEYALRAWHYAVRVYTNAAAVLNQQAGKIVQHGRHYSTHHPAWRRYYMARNAMHALRQYPGRRPLLLGGLLLLLYQGLGVLCFETNKWHKLMAMLVGVGDGLRSHLGRLEDCHPRLARRWWPS